MNAIVKPPKVRNNNNNIHSLRKFYDDVKSNICSLSSLGIETSAHGTLIATLILEKLLQEIKLIVARNVQETWDLIKVFEIINQQLGAREACKLKIAKDVQNSSDNYEGFPGAMSSWHINSQYCNYEQKFANIKSVFCDHGHWSDKCYPKP